MEDSRKAETVRRVETDEALNSFDHELLTRLIVEKLGKPDGLPLEENHLEEKDMSFNYEQAWKHNFCTLAFAQIERV